MRRATGLSLGFACLGLGAAALLIQSCGKKSGSDDAGGGNSAWLDAFPSGFAISSLTAQSGSSLSTQEESATIDSDASFVEKKEALEAILNADSSSGCAVVLPTIQTLNQRANCYGPQVNYSNHPDGGGGSGQFPTGDLGMWNATESSGEACASAQMNSLTSSASSYVDAALAMTASMACLLKNSDTALPASGESVDVTTSFNSALSSGNTGASVSSATVTGGSNSTYTYTVVATIDGSTLTVNLKHQPLDTDNTTYQGRIWGTRAGSGDKNGFSVSYKKSSTNLNVRMMAANWPSSTSDTTIFGASGDISMGSGWSGNMNHALFSVDPDTGAGNLSYAWQAGSGDSNTRVFNAYTNSSGTGCGFFGYGSSFSSTLDSNTNSISTFICNWAGPGASHTGVTGKAQKQCMSRSGTGVFTPTTSNISYSPKNSCSYSGGAFTYDFPTHYSSSTLTDDLVTLSSDTDYGSYSAPSAPDLGSDF